LHERGRDIVICSASSPMWRALLKQGHIAGVLIIRLRESVEQHLEAGVEAVNLRGLARHLIGQFLYRAHQMGEVDFGCFKSIVHGRSLYMLSRGPFYRAGTHFATVRSHIGVAPPFDDGLMLGQTTILT
jgi:hypothetical protein